MTRYAIGIDCGNTAIKAALFDQYGSEIVVVSSEFPTHIPLPEYTEADMQQCWELCVDNIKRLIESAAVRPEQIIALGCSGHGNGLYLLDKQRDPLLAIKSLDNRAKQEVKALLQSERFPLINVKNRQGVWNSQSAVLLLWLKVNQPETYHRIGQVLFCKDYLNFRLTGECGTDWGDISASGLFDFETDSVSSELLTAYSIADISDKLPPIRESNQITGSVTAEVAKQTGLKEGTPVIAGLFDVVACAYGSGAVANGDVSVVAGTWNINQVMTDSLPPAQLSMACKTGDKRYLAIESSTCSASNLEWLVQRFFHQKNQQLKLTGSSVFEQFNHQLEHLELSDSLPVFHPYLYGSPEKQLSSASLTGLKGWHQDIDIVYAVYEGIVFAHRRHIEKLREAGYQVDTVALSGGASRSDYWCQMFADVLQVRVNADNCREIGAKGAAMLAFATVSGKESQLSTEKPADGVRSFIPDGDKNDFYSQRYGKYCRIAKILNEL